MVNRYIPSRGDLVFLDFSPQAGHEQAGRRPAIVLSPKKYNKKTGLSLMCPITSKAKGYSFEVSFKDKGGISGVVLSDHIKSVDWRARKISFIEKVETKVLDEVLGKLGALLFGIR